MNITEYRQHIKTAQEVTDEALKELKRLCHAQKVMDRFYRIRIQKMKREIQEGTYVISGPN